MIKTIIHDFQASCDIAFKVARERGTIVAGGIVQSGVFKHVKVFGIWHFVFGNWYLVFVIWYLVIGIWYLVFGIWYGTVIAQGPQKQWFQGMVGMVLYGCLTLFPHMLIRS